MRQATTGQGGPAVAKPKSRAKLERELAELEKSRRRIPAVDVLGEVRRAMRILRRVERYIVQEERAAKRAGEKRKVRVERAQAALASGRARTVDEALELGGQP